MSPEDIEKLVEQAKASVDNAIAPFSGFRVGVALMADDGAVYTGCNIENPSLMLTICAERVALYKAISEGKRTFTAIAIASVDERYCYPCGVCRQLMTEYAGEAVLILASRDGIKMLKVRELLPFPFQV